jgi:iron complex outermembrane receptor protein
MTDMIVWLPYNQAYWSPVNMQRVYSKGVDGLMKWSFHSKIVKWDNTYRMQLNQSTSEGKVLPYMPQAIHALQTNLRWGKWNAGGSAVYTSQRFTDAHNKAIWSLDPYWLFGAELARQYEWSRHTVLVVASVNNVLNTPYQSVRGYAMPGRYFQIQISYQIKQYHDVKNVEAELLRDVGGH